MNIKVYNHASIKLQNNKVIYFDPYNLESNENDADYIFITHDHYDHFDPKSIQKVIKEDTIIVVPTSLEEKAKQLTKNIQVVKPNNSYKLDNLSFQTIPSYNINKDFHKKKYNYVGYNVLIDGLYYYIMGDTDRTKETDKINADVIFVPIGGTFTMNYQEAASYINDKKPTKVIPIHYGSIVGDKSLGNSFKDLIDKNIEVEIYIK